MTPIRLVACSFVLVLAAGGAQAGFGNPGLDMQESPGLVRIATTVEEMPAEMARAYIEDIQGELIARGYNAGIIDGVMGQRTRGAIRAYQRDIGLPVDGVASKELLEYMLFNKGGATSGSEPVPSLDPVFVRSVQIELVERGYYHGEIDGIAGPKTREAVDRFQRDAGLVVNGAMDQRLLEELRTQPTSVRAYGG
jgi:peptidoglycan hydrolase-like protein with peptidoglycan-binding domain